jgi:hypothetical protein
MLTAVEAAEEFTAEVPIFCQAWQDGWLSASNSFDPLDDARCRTTILQMRAVSAARTLFDGNPEIEYMCAQNMHLLVVRDIAVFRFKKLDQQFLSRNYPTATAEGIYRQEGLPGMEDIPWLTVGIVPNTDWTDYSGVYMTCPRSSASNNWVLNISSGVAKDINELETNFDHELEQPERARFRPRKDLSGEGSSFGNSGV